MLQICWLYYQLIEGSPFMPRPQYDRDAQITTNDRRGLYEIAASYLRRKDCAARRQGTTSGKPIALLHKGAAHSRAGQRQAASFIKSAQTYAICGTSTPPTGVVPVRAARPPSRS